jgi:hypothetical protein
MTSAPSEGRGERAAVSATARDGTVDPAQADEVAHTVALAIGLACSSHVASHCASELGVATPVVLADARRHLDEMDLPDAAAQARATLLLELAAEQQRA